jgi:hypothetical protein
MARAQAHAGLIVASLAFYAWWNWRFLALLLFSILFNFALGTRLQRRASTDGSPASDIPTHACAWKAMNGRSWRCGSRRRF